MNVFKYDRLIKYLLLRWNLVQYNKNIKIPTLKVPIIKNFKHNGFGSI